MVTDIDGKTSMTLVMEWKLALRYVSKTSNNDLPITGYFKVFLPMKVMVLGCTVYTGDIVIRDTFVYKHTLMVRYFHANRAKWA